MLQIAENSLAKDLRWFRIGQEYESCSRRVTAMQWHPSIPNVLVAGGKDGSITLFSSEEIENNLQLWRGVSILYVLLSHIYCSIVIVKIYFEILVEISV